MTREPAVIIGVIVAIVTVIVQNLFPSLAVENQQLILAATAAVAALVQAVLTRMFVTPVADPRDSNGRSLKA